MRLVGWLSETIAYLLVCGGAVFGGTWIAMRYGDWRFGSEAEQLQRGTPRFAEVELTAIWLVATAGVAIALGELLTT
jgi:hypothetical protein